MMDEPILFDSAHAALVFAFNFAGQHYAASAMNKAMTGSLGSGKGLIGLDGAGQAGMIRRELSTLCELHQAVLLAKHAPRSVPCDCGKSCCSGGRPNPEWEAAIVWLTAEAARAQISWPSHYNLRRGIIEKVFGVKKDLMEIADDCKMHRNSVGKHHTAIRQWLCGSGPRKGIPSQPGALHAAEDRAETLLRLARMVGEMESV